MKIVIMGVGAMGSIYAALLADAGNEVWAVDVWREHLDAIRDRGLRVEGASGDRTVTTIHTAEDPAEAGPADLYIIATKADGVAAAAEAVSRAMGPESLILTIQNGLGAGERIAAHAPADRVLLGVAQGFGASMKGPGHAHHNGMSMIRIGEMQGGLTDRLARVVKVWEKAGFTAKAFEDIDQLIWEKFLCNCAYSAPCAAFDRTIGEILADPATRAISEGCAKEVYALGKAKGVNFTFDDPVAYARAFGEKMPASRPSMLLDHHAKRRSEIDAINGMAATLGARMGVPTPYNETLSAIVRDKEAKFG
jgi:2-dehydropantoate 2-reductase